MRKVRQARLSNVPKATQLGRVGAGFEPKHQRMLPAASQEQTLGVRHFLIQPDIDFLPHSTGISWLSLPQKCAVSLEQTWVVVARASLGTALAVTGSTCGPCLAAAKCRGWAAAPRRQVRKGALGLLAGRAPQHLKRPSDPA